MLSVGLLTLNLVQGAAKLEPAPANEIPARVILTWTGDPARTQHVTWRTEAPLASAQAEIAPVSADPAFGKSARAVEGTASRIDVGAGKMAGHYKAEFTGLQPDTEYSYRVGNGRAWSEWNVFRTAHAEAAPFRFLYIGDAQNDIKSLWSRTIRAAYRRAPDARFIAMAGDLVAEGFDDRLWGELCGGLGFISSSVPLLPAPGNHDLHQADKSNSFHASPMWRSHFGLPHNGPQAAELDQQSYYLDYQGVRFVVIDVNSFDGAEHGDIAGRERIRDAEIAWVEQTLKTNPNPRAIVVQHQPVFPIAHDRDYPEMQRWLAPLYEKYKVALVLQGHDHSYGRMRRNGVTYVISVSGPKMYDLQSKYVAMMEKTATNRQLYQVVDVGAGRIRLASYSVDGALVDSVEITR